MPFNLDRLQSELAQNAYPIVHLATHGKFGIDARDTFLVTGGRRGERREERGERGNKGTPSGEQCLSLRTGCSKL